MQRVLATDAYKVRDRFRVWRDTSQQLGMPTDFRRTGDGVFGGQLEAATIGGLGFTRTAFSALSCEGTARTVRRADKGHSLALALRYRGTSYNRQYDRAVAHRPGELMVLDAAAPFDMEFTGLTRGLLIEIPRARLESMLGPARLYAALTVPSDAAGASLTRTFFDELVRVHGTLSPEMAERMTSVGVDLLVAGIAERLARETPRPIHGTVTVQRAKAYVEANLGDPNLDPPQLAAAMGVSLRRLQELFHERGRHISDHIWGRRLEVAAQRLANPGHAHLSIGVVSYGCGFANQAHFSKRFRNRHGVSPSEYRRAALLSGLHEPVRQ